MITLQVFYWLTVIIIIMLFVGIAVQQVGIAKGNERAENIGGYLVYTAGVLAIIVLILVAMAATGLIK